MSLWISMDTHDWIFMMENVRRGIHSRIHKLVFGKVSSFPFHDSSSSSIWNLMDALNRSVRMGGFRFGRVWRRSRRSRWRWTEGGWTPWLGGGGGGGRNAEGGEGWRKRRRIISKRGGELLPPLKKINPKKTPKMLQKTPKKTKTKP